MKDQKKFYQYLVMTRGCTGGTADLYTSDVRIALSHKDGYLGRLQDDIAPKTKHHIRAALIAYARFTKDIEMEETLKNLKLPPAKRVSTKTPLQKQQWVEFRKYVDACTYVDIPTRCAIGIMINRGLRVSDVLNIQHDNVIKALETGTLMVEVKDRKWAPFGVVQSFKSYLEILSRIKDKWVYLYELITDAKGSKQQKKNARLRIWRVVKHMAKDLGIENVSPHRFRRTFAVEMLNHPKVGGNLELLRQAMAWSSIAIAQTYLDHDQQKQVDEIADDL
jgi:integrase